MKKEQKYQSMDIIQSPSSYKLDLLREHLNNAHDRYKKIIRSEDFNPKSKEYKKTRDEYLSIAEDYRKEYAKFIKNYFKENE